MKLSLITNPYDLKHETQTINHLFGQGLHELHLRKPNYGKDEIIRYIREIEPQYHTLISLHSCYSLVHEFPIQCIHLDRDSRKNLLGKWILHRWVLKGKSYTETTTVSSYKALYHIEPMLDEVILGPVCSHASVTQTTPLFKTESLVRAISQCPVPVIASGGITIQNATYFGDVGFEGLALQSAIWKSPDPRAAFEQIQALTAHQGRYRQAS
jgi:thiamine monophosphate synthase